MGVPVLRCLAEQQLSASGDHAVEPWKQSMLSAHNFLNTLYTPGGNVRRARYEVTLLTRHPDIGPQIVKKSFFQRDRFFFRK